MEIMNDQSFIQIDKVKAPDFLDWCFAVTGHINTREEIDLLIAMLTTVRGFLPEKAAKRG